MISLALSKSQPISSLPVHKAPALGRGISRTDRHRLQIGIKGADISNDISLKRFDPPPWRWRHCLATRVQSAQISRVTSADWNALADRRIPSRAIPVLPPASVHLSGEHLAASNSTWTQTMAEQFQHLLPHFADGRSEIDSQTMTCTLAERHR